MKLLVRIGGSKKQVSLCKQGFVLSMSKLVLENHN